MLRIKLLFCFFAKQMPRAGIEPATQGFSVLCSTNWAIWARLFQDELRGQDLNLRPSGYEPDELPDCSTPRYKIKGFRQWTEVDSNHRSKMQQIYSLSPLASRESVHYETIKLQKPMIGLEPITCWLQISCSANWATSAYKLTNKNGTNRARTCDPLLVRQVLSQLSYDPILIN